MPGPDLEYPPVGPDLFPKDESEHAQLLGWCNQAFTAAKSAKQTREDKWRKYHRVYRSYINRTQTWRSAVFIPYTFSAIETIVPKMVSQLPTFVVTPVGPEDVTPAKLMEGELQRSAQENGFYVELIKVMKTSLKYGTGILKNYYLQKTARAYEPQPVMETVPGQMQPVTNEANGGQMSDLQGNPMMTQGPPTQQPAMGPNGQPQMQMVGYDYIVYDGPASIWVDPFHFWVAPEATTLDDARYTIERFYRERTYIEEKIKEGIYQLPPGKTSVEECFPEDETPQVRGDEVDEQPQTTGDDTRKPVMLLEFHTDDNRIITAMGGGTAASAIIRVSENPYWHGEKPYAVFPDYIQEGEFWGLGEVEAIEGLQDLVNAIYNQRIDNVRLSIDTMFGVNTKALEDERDLQIRPGGIVRVTGDWTPQEAISRYEFGDVTGSAYAEVDQLEKLIERVSGVSGYQLGIQEEGMNRTATGVSLATEAGNSKFALKVRLMELVGLKRVARQWGAIIQQYTDQQRAVRVMGPSGQWLFPTLTPDAIQGALDYSIDVSSTAQTESVRKDQATMLFQTLAPALPQAIPKLAQDLLEAFGKKDAYAYIMGSPDLMMLTQMMQAQQQGGIIAPQAARTQMPGQPEATRGNWAYVVGPNQNNAPPQGQPPNQQGQVA